MFKCFTPVLKSIADPSFAFLSYPVCNCIFIMKLVACPATIFTIVSFIAVIVTAAFNFLKIEAREGEDAALGRGRE